MKTALSLPDDLYESAEKLAEERGISRSSLYAEAMRYYLEQQRADKVMEELNAYYAAGDSRMDAGLRKVQGKSIRRSSKGDEW